MSIIKTISPEEPTEGKVENAYSFWKKNAGVIPLPFQLLSASPELLDCQLQKTKYFFNHQSLGFPLLTLIRYLTAKKIDYKFCTAFNGNLLKRQGMSDQEVARLEHDATAAPVDEKDQAMLAFVSKALENNHSIEKEDIDRLKQHGWTEKDIFDAVYHAVMLIMAPGILMKVFKMDIPNKTCVIL